jgi:hypothetical protein
VEVGRADGHDHELLEVHVVIGMNAAVQDVHHGRGQDVGVGGAEIGVERLAGGCGRGARDGKRCAEDGVCAEAPLVGRSVGLDHRAVHATLVARVGAHEQRADLAVHVAHRLAHAFALVTARVAVAELHRLELPGRGSRGDYGAAEGAVLQLGLHLHRGVPARV